LSMTTATIQHDPLLDHTAAAALLGISTWTLRSWRRRGVRKGPRFVRVGMRAVKFPLSELTAFVDRKRAESFAETDIN
jgi:predicted DNA-binding transcriptional regulator AlpA